MAFINTHIHLRFFLRILKSLALKESKIILLPKIAVIILFLFSLNTLFEDYLAKFFGFHDLGLINDFLANTIHRGKTFYVSTLDVNHLSWHFSPTLFLITPFYLIFDSQFVFLALNALAIYFSISLLSKLTFDVLKKNNVSIEYIWFTILAFIILTTLGTFTINVLGAGHFEVFYIPIVSLIFYFYCKGYKTWLIFALMGLAWGIRQDAGFILSFQLISLLFIPSSFILSDQKPQKKVIIFGALFSILATVFITMFVIPMYGTDVNWHATRLWGHLGENYSEIFLKLLFNPGILFNELKNSAYIHLNEGFLFINFLNPLVGILNNLPGFLYYTTQSIERKSLFWYSSSFLLPGIYFSFLVGLCYLGKWTQALIPYRRNLFYRAVGPVLMLLLVLGGLNRVFHDSNKKFSTYEMKYRFTIAENHLEKEIHKVIEKCRGHVLSVSSDFKTFTFLPNYLMKFLLDRYEKSDLVFYIPGETSFMSAFSSLKEFKKNIDKNPEYSLVHKHDMFMVYARSDIDCFDKTIL